MKKCILSLIMAALAYTLWAQAPAAFNYQAIFRNSNGILIQNADIDIKIEIISITSAKVVYSELHACTTSKTGLVNIEIGRGETSNNIEDIDWGHDSYSIQVSYDTERKGNFIALGSSQLLSVPYALYAANSSKQQISINGNIIKLTDGGQVTLPIDQINDADADTTNELQLLTKNGDILSLSKSNEEPVDLSEYRDNTDAQTLTVADGKLKILGGNEIELSELSTGTDNDEQTLLLTEQVLSISNGNNVDLSDFMDNTDSQKLTLNNDTLYLTNGDKVYLGAYTDNTDNQTLNLWGTTLEIFGGNSVDLSQVDTKLTETEVDEMVANNGYITTEVDASTTNEIQDLELIGSTLKITNNANATEINLAPFTGNDTDDQTLELNGTTLSIADGNSVDLAFLQDGTTDADADPANEIQQLSINGDTISLTFGGSITLPQGFSGNYNDLSGKPDFTDWDTNISDDFSGNYNDLTNKPVLAGDVTGETGLTSVEKIRGRNISINEPGNGQILKWNSTTLTWEPADDQLGAAGSTDGVVASIGVVGTTTKTITLNRTNSLGSLTATFADNVDDADADATNEIQDLSIAGNTLSLTGDATTVNLAAYLDNTDAQELSLSGSTISISGGNSIDISTIDTKLTEAQVDSYVSNNGYLTSFTEVDGSVTNEIQTISLSGSTVSLSNSGGSITLPDASSTNEIQDLSLTGNTLSLTGDATMVSLSTYLDNTDAQELSLSGSTLSISGGNSINLSSIDTKLTEAQVDSYVSNNGYLTNFTEVDGSVTNELQTLSLSGSSLSISGTGGNTVSLSSLASPFSTTTGITSNANGNYANDDFVFGSATLDYSGITDHCSRMFFDKSKGAFRVGADNSTYSNAINIGSYSFASGVSNKASGNYSTAFGILCEATDSYTFAVGQYSKATASCAIAAGNTCTASGANSVAMGNGSQATQSAATAFGYNSKAKATYSIAAGDRCEATGEASVSMGTNCLAAGINSVSIGYLAYSKGNYSIALGYNARNLGTNSCAIGEYSGVQEGYSNATAIGRYATCENNGQFIVCDGTSTSSFYNLVSNVFAARFTNGYYFYTNSNSTTGVYLSAGAASWSSVSDSTKKENFKSVNGEDFLNKISKFRLTSWNYKGQDAATFRHYGPMAQDFYNAFGNDGIGNIGCDTLIATADFLGVSFIAVQALEKRTTELKQAQQELAKQVEKISQLESLVNEQNTQLQELKKLKAEISEIKTMLGIEALAK